MIELILMVAFATVGTYLIETGLQEMKGKPDTKQVKRLFGRDLKG